MESLKPHIPVKVESRAHTALLHWESTFQSYFRSHYQPSDAAHDLSHFRRVWNIAKSIMEHDKGANPLVVLTACYFHDWVSLPKNHPQRHTSSQLAAKETTKVLTGLSFPMDLIQEVAHAIEAHSFSGGIPPKTLEAKIVQDADRMESLGYIGIARCFAVAGAINRPLFDGEDPLAANRPLDDQSFALDHFQTKLLKLAGSMQTMGGQRIAKERSRVIEQFMHHLADEVMGSLN